jgi:hypothetical protein
VLPVNATLEIFGCWLMAAPTVVPAEDLKRAGTRGEKICTITVDNIHNTGRETGLDYKIDEFQGGQGSDFGRLSGCFNMEEDENGKFNHLQDDCIPSGQRGTDFPRQHQH